MKYSPKALWKKITELPRGKRIAVQVGGSIFLFLFLLAGSAEFTSRPNFCITCHYMEPYYESWTLSSHKEISCVTCHYPPGIEGTIHGKMAGLIQLANYVGRSYTRRKPWAEIDDASCLQSGCHETRKLEGEVMFKGVVFDHTDHLGELRRGKELRCTSCHSQVVQGEHILVTESTCFLCHFKEDDTSQFAPLGHELQPIKASQEKDLSRCTTCHQWDKISVEDMKSFRYDHTKVAEEGMACVLCHPQTVIGDGFVPEDNCVSCHFEADRLNKYNDSELMHRVHISQNKIECAQCHLRVQHKIERISPTTKLDCETCHATTHQEQVFLFTGKDTNGFEGTPNPMFEVGLNCASCHVFHKEMLATARTKEATPESCETCHGKGFGRLLNLWEQAAENKANVLQADIARVEQSVRRGRKDSLQVALAHIEEARYAMHLVQVGKAVHNATFSDELIRKGNEKLNAALETAGVSFRLPVTAIMSLVPGDCANCHAGVEAIDTPFRNAIFSHNLHVVKESVECKTCHSNAQKHGQLLLSPAECNDCHHKEQPALSSCLPCHQGAQTFYAGTYLQKASPDLMFEEDVTCTDCHMVKRKIVRPTAVVCVDCHDSEYEDMGNEWIKDVETLSAEVKTLLQNASPAFKQSEAYQKAQRVLQDIEKSGARGLHNYEMTMDLLREIKKSMMPGV